MTASDYQGFDARLLKAKDAAVDAGNLAVQVWIDSLRDWLRQSYAAIERTNAETLVRNAEAMAGKTVTAPVGTASKSASAKGKDAGVAVVQPVVSQVVEPATVGGGGIVEPKAAAFPWAAVALLVGAAVVLWWFLRDNEGS